MSGPTNWRDGIEVHPAADLFPMMSDAELDELAADIAKYGIRQPIIWFGNKLIDGRNRIAAVDRIPDKARRAQIVRELEAGKHRIVMMMPPDPLAYVISANIRRRHLTPAQKREIIAALLKANPERSDRATAKIAQVNHKTVAVVRGEAEGRGEILHTETRTDTIGRQQPATKALAVNDTRPDDAADVAQEGVSIFDTAWARRLVRADNFEAAAQQVIDEEAQRIKRRLSTLGTRSPAEIAAAVAQIDKAAQETMRRVMDGGIAPRDIRRELNGNIYRFAREAKRESPLFAQFTNQLADRIAAMREKLQGDGSVGIRLAEIAKAIPDLSLPEDQQAVARISYELQELSQEVAKRAEAWRRRLGGRA